MRSPLPSLSADSPAGGLFAPRVDLLLFACALVSLASAQTVNPPTATKPATDEAPIVLAPFEVDATRDTGYAAQRDLSGTRLNTALRDVAAPVTVLTEELLDDIGAVNVTDAFDFMANVEFDTLNNDANFSYAKPRIRGSSAANSVMVGFFPEFSDMDRYKLEQLGTARGPNALLAGIGDPAGTLTASTKSAGFKHAGQIETMFSNWGSARGIVDLNRVLIPGRLAVRSVMLQQYNTTAIQPTYRRDRRIYLAGTARLFERGNFRTTVRGNYEWIDGVDLVPNGNLVVQNLATWMAAGRPTKPNSTGGVLPGTANNSTLLVDVPGLPLMNWAGTMSTTGTAVPVLEESLYPYDRNVKGNEAIAPREVDQGAIHLQQQIGRSLFLEAAVFHAEELNIWPVKVTGATLSADPNQLLPNGQPNSNVGKYFVQHDGRTDTRLGTRDVIRLQAAWTFNFDQLGPRWGRWLGRHNLFGLFERYELWSALERLQTVNTTPLPGFSTNLANSANRVYHRSYLDYANGVYSFKTYDYRTVLEKNGVRAEAMPTLDQTTGLTINRSRSFALQSYFWKDRIATMLGLRTDESETYSGKPLRDTRGLSPLARSVPVSLDVVNKFKPVTKGVVVHPVEWLSLTYSESENFKAGASTLLDHFGRNLPTEAGEGRDYGVRLSLFQRRLAVALNKYESGAVNATDSTSVDGVSQINRIWTALGRSELELPGWPTTRDTFDNTASGYELSLTFNAHRNWRLQVVGAQNSTVVTNNRRGFRDYVATHKATWLQRPDLVTSEANTIRTEVADLEEIVRRRESQEGVKEFNMRKYKGSVVVSYRFPQGALKGLRLTANVRYLGDAIVGTPVVNGISLKDQAFVEKGYAIAGLGASYSRTFGHYEGYASLAVKNALDYDGRVEILSRSTSNGLPLKARWIEGTSATLTSGVRF
ncbi:MAG: hypothetical protein FJ382_13375 [Verrucomicrobia bacterium]|nr:hypothetical protein [Verrucomicrobiota bacterium]